MHIDYSKESLNEYKKEKTEGQELRFLQFMFKSQDLLNNEFLVLVESFNDEKINSICETIRSTFGDKYKKITTKQTWALAYFILENMTAEESIERAFKVSEEKSEIQIIIEKHGAEQVKNWLIEDMIKKSHAIKIVNFELKPSLLVMGIINYNLSII